jgi:hypothetical protein
VRNRGVSRIAEDAVYLDRSVGHLASSLGNDVKLATKPVERVNCPMPESLIDHLAGELTFEFEYVSIHVASCRECQLELDALRMAFRIAFGNEE